MKKKQDHFIRPASRMVDIVFHEVFNEQVYSEGFFSIKDIKHPVVLDIGAFIGLTPLYFAQHLGARIYAVEPNPESFAYLKENTKNYDRITCIQGAISYKAGKRDMKKGETDIPMSFFDEGERAFTVDCITLPQVFTDYKIKHVDLMKIDVEGAEFEIIGSKSFDAVKDKIDVIIGESHDTKLSYRIFRPILEYKGFATGTLPYENYTKYFNLEIPDEEPFKVEYKEKTMFIAKRKDLIDQKDKELLIPA